MSPDAGPTKGKTEQWQAILVSLLLGAAVMGCFWPVTRNQFINMDDLDYITQNPRVQAGLSWQTIKWAFTTFHAGNWHPLTWLSHALDCQLFGLNTAGHHAVSAALHAANAVLLFLVLLRLTSRPQASTFNLQPSTLSRCVFVAVLFGLHPMHVESVAWAAERKDVLSAFFFILTIWAYAKYAEFKTQNSKLKTQNYCLALLLFALALMSKPMVVTLPFVLLLLDFWPLRRFQLSTINSQPSTIPKLRTLVLEKLPFLALSLGASILTVLAQKENGYVIPVETVPFDARLINAAVSYTMYLRKLFWPIDLALYYPLNPDLPMEYGFAAAFLILLTSIAAFTWLRTRPYVLVGWLWFLGTLIPVIGLLQVGLQSMADRYSYIPSIGLFVAVVWLVADLAAGLPVSSPWSVVRRIAPATVGVSALIACAVLTEPQIGYWKNNETLYRHALKVAPDNPLIIGNLGCALVEAGRYKEATDYLEQALKGHPGSAEAQVSWGVALGMQGRNEEAVNHYHRAIELNPQLERPHYLLAGSLLAQGERSKAAREYEIALQINPDSSEAANDFAWILATAPDPALRNGPRAVALGETACRLTKYSDPLFIGTLAAAYAEAGRFEDAVKAAKKAEATAQAGGDKNLAARNGELRSLYEKRQPYHETDKTPQPTPPGQ